MAKPMQSTKEYDGNSLILHYYFDEKIQKKPNLNYTMTMVYKTDSYEKDNLK